MSHRDYQQLSKFKLLFCDWGGNYISLKIEIMF